MAEQQTFLSMISGSFATPAAENPTVAMMEAAYEHHHINARYLNCEVAPDALADAVRGARAMGWVGFNCSIPHKVAVIEHLDGVGSSAALIGAVNCVVRRGDRYIGENTDGQGFLTALRTVADPTGKVFVLFGAGGAARAIAVEVALAGAVSITIVNRDLKRGSELVAGSMRRRMQKRILLSGTGLFAFRRQAISSSMQPQSGSSRTWKTGSISISIPCALVWSLRMSFPIRRVHN